MTEERKLLIDKFQKWLDIDPRKQIIAAVCANIAEEYADVFVYGFVALSTKLANNQKPIVQKRRNSERNFGSNEL